MAWRVTQPIGVEVEAAAAGDPEVAWRGRCWNLLTYGQPSSNDGRMGNNLMLVNTKC
jgi:hypothetical protein